MPCNAICEHFLKSGSHASHHWSIILSILNRGSLVHAKQQERVADGFYILVWSNQSFFHDMVQIINLVRQIASLLVKILDNIFEYKKIYTNKSYLLTFPICYCRLHVRYCRWYPISLNEYGRKPQSDCTKLHLGNLKHWLNLDMVMKTWISF